MNIKYEDLRVLILFCLNRVDFNKFKELDARNFEDNYYITLFQEFTGNPLNYIVTRGESQLLENITKEIIKTDYKG